MSKEEVKAKLLAESRERVLANIARRKSLGDVPDGLEAAVTQVASPMSPSRKSVGGQIERAMARREQKAREGAITASTGGTPEVPTAVAGTADDAKKVAGTEEVTQPCLSNHIAICAFHGLSLRCLPSHHVDPGPASRCSTPQGARCFRSTRLAPGTPPTLPSCDSSHLPRSKVGSVPRSHLMRVLRELPAPAPLNLLAALEALQALASVPSPPNPKPL